MTRGAGAGVVLMAHDGRPRDVVMSQYPPLAHHHRDRRRRPAVPGTRLRPRDRACAGAVARGRRAARLRRPLTHATRIRWPH